MIYKKNRTNIVNIHFILLVVSFLCIVLSFFNIFKIIPFFDIFNVSISNFILLQKENLNSITSAMDDNRRLANDNIELRKQLLKTDIEIGKINELKNQIDSLKSFSNIVDKKYVYLEAQSIEAIFADKLPVDITVNKGLINGIKEGQIVINDTGSLIGRIYSVNQYISKIRPYYREDFKIPVKSLSTQTAFISGVKYGVVYAQDINQNSDIKNNDLFYTSSLGDKVPEGIFIGKFQKYDLDDQRKILLQTDMLNISNLYIIQ